MAGDRELLRAFTILCGAVNFEIGRAEFVVVRKENQTHHQIQAMRDRLDMAMRRALATMEGKEGPNVEDLPMAQVPSDV